MRKQPNTYDILLQSYAAFLPMTSIFFAWYSKLQKGAHIFKYILQCFNIFYTYT